MTVEGAVARRIAVLTSGGDSAGMNPAVRAAVRTGLAADAEMFAVEEGLQGLIDGGERIRSVTSADVSGILQLGGTVLGTARSADFRTRDGRRRAAANLLERGIDGLVVIGGDGSLTGADVLRSEWSGLIDELVERGVIDRSVADAHRSLALVGIVGSIDNDMVGTDMTIGADTALHRITEAVDAIQSTASSHQRTFVVEVMGRHCGYLGLMSSISTGANFVLIPENPPEDGWQDAMCEVLSGGRRIGRRANIVIVAEGTRDVHGHPITASEVRTVLEERLGEDVRVTVLGHVQRGGSPSSFDRYLGTVLGEAAVRQLLDRPDEEPQLIGVRGQRITRTPLMECVATTRSIADAVGARDVDRAMDMRGGSFTASFRLLRTLVRARPGRPDRGARSLRLAVLHADSPAPGMNAAVRVAVRVGMDRGHQIVAVRDGLSGLRDGTIEEMDWISVSGWVSHPGARLGTNLFVPDADDLVAMVANVEAHEIDGLLLIGGWTGYAAAEALALLGQDAGRPPIPVVCVPTSINNDLPATDLSIGADSALNSIRSDVDKIKESAVASQRCFIVEVMGRDCGYLTLMSGLATGAERIHIPEEETTLSRLQDDLDALRAGFALGKRRGLVVRGDRADELYTTDFVASLFQHKSGGVFDVRTAVLGHLQQGGAPSPFDRILASRLTSAAIEHLIDQVESGDRASTMVGMREGGVELTPLDHFTDLVDPHARRPRSQGWWMALRSLADTMGAAQP